VIVVAEKRYYWLKLKEDFFASKRVKKLRQMAGGDTYLIIYLKLQLKAMKNDGVIKFDHLEDTIADELALDLDESADNVKVTLSYLIGCGLAETNAEASLLFLPYAVENVGSEGASAKRMRDARERSKLVDGQENVTLCAQSATLCEHRYGEIEKEIEKEKDIDINSAKKTEKKAADAGKSAELDRKFDLFWSEYPKKSDKKKARLKFKSINPDDALFQRMMDGLAKWKRSEQWSDIRFVPLPTTWLNGERWEDEVPKSARAVQEDKDLREFKFYDTGI
jgi:predicted phage replisome organizer